MVVHTKGVNKSVARLVMHPRGIQRIGKRTVSSPNEVDSLIAAIAELPERTAVIYHTGRPPTGNVFFYDPQNIYDHELTITVNERWGYLRMWTIADGDHDWILRGSPDSPGITNSEVQFCAGSGVPIVMIAAALREFLASAQRPECVMWALTEAD
jgi:hypothetical protein